MDKWLISHRLPQHQQRGLIRKGLRKKNEILQQKMSPNRIFCRKILITQHLISAFLESNKETENEVLIRSGFKNGHGSVMMWPKMLCFAFHARKLIRKSYCCSSTLMMPLCQEDSMIGKKELERFKNMKNLNSTLSLLIKSLMSKET